MNVALEQSLILFLLMLAGFVLGKVGVIKNFRELSRLVVDVTLPALIIVSMQKDYSAETAMRALTMLLASASIYAVTLLLGYFIPLLMRRLNPESRGVHRFGMSFSNVGFMGFPIANAYLGAESLFDVSMYNIPFQVLAFSVGVWFIAPKQESASKRNYSKLLLNPAILSAVLGFLLFILRIRLPRFAFAFLTIVGDTTTPLAMMIIGGILSQNSLKEAVSNLSNWITCAYRLLVFPLVLYGVLSLFGFEQLSVPVLIGAMPVAANTSMLAEVYKGDSKTASSLVFLSTILSSATIPLLAWLLHLAY